MIIGSKAYKFDESKNSMELAKEYINTAPDGAIFLVKNLQQAHGRQDRVWTLYPEQLSVTFLLKPVNLNKISKQDLPLRLTQLNMAIALGIFNVLKKFEVKLKWPNDFMLNNKKLGGMIIELIWNESLLQGIVVGFSININNVFDHSDELYEIATSLKQVFNKNFDIDILQEKILQSIDEFYQKWLNQKFDEIFKQWKENQFYKNKIIQVHQKDRSFISGLFSDVLSNGDLILLPLRQASSFVPPHGGTSKDMQGDCDKEIIIPFYLVDQISQK